MAISLSQRFSHVGEIRDMFDAINGAYSSLDAAKNALVDIYETGNLQELLCDVETYAAGMMSGLDAGCKNFQSHLIRYFINKMSLENWPRVDVTRAATEQQILAKTMVALWEELAAASQSVRSNGVTVGTISEDKGSNHGELFVITKLPGDQAPVVDGFGNLYYWDENTQMSKTDTCVVECYNDSYGPERITRGNELFRISGLPSQPAPFASRIGTDGDGTVQFLQPVQGRSVVDLGFDDYAVANTPDDWVITAGSPGTEILQESTNVVTGSALELTGTCSLNRPISTTLVNGRSQMALVLLLRKDGTSGGTVTIQVTGTGMTTATTGAITASGLTTTFAPRHLRVPIPAQVPTDLKIVISTSGITGGPIYIDHGGFAPYTYWNGLGFCISDGQSPFYIGDHYQFTITNDYAGDNQTTLARVLRCQTRSADAGYTFA